MMISRLAILAIALTLLSLEPVFGQAREQVEFLMSDPERRDVFELALDRIGAVPAQGVGVDRLRAVAAQIDAQVTEVFPDSFVVLDLGRTVERGELVNLAMEIKERSDLVQQAGMVLYQPGSESPMLVLDEIVVQFEKGTDEGAARALADAFDLEPIMNNPGLPEQWLFRLQAPAEHNLFQVVEQSNQFAGVEFAHPNIVPVIDYRQFVPNDPLFGNQWHHANTGQGGGTVDADTDTDLAWDITLGQAVVTIAVMDSGFDLNHEDLQPNLWANPGETAGNNADDDGNGWVDDVNGYNFGGCTAMTGPACGSGTITGADHGMSVAGVAAARGHNGLGVAGACPNCSVIAIQRGRTSFADALGITYAMQVGANILTNSWGYSVGTPVPMNVTAAINATAAGGTTIFWAMNNDNRNDCTGTPDISANPNVIAVSALSNQDRKVTESAFGNCMELSAPTHRGYGPHPNQFPAGSGVAFTGTLNVATTDRVGNNGYNSTSPQNAARGFDPNFCPAESADRNYTLCFGGTSSATPLTAGIGGLALSAAPALTSQQLQRVLQDTADKVEDSTAAYAETSGFSAPATGVATHGYGRVNAFEAVRLVADRAAGGRGGVDIFVRDNRLDWGNTEQPSNVLMEPARGFIAHYVSVDIKVDAPAYQPAPTTPAAFDAFAHEDPISGAVNKVYVRVHNRGQQPANEVLVKLHWAFAGTALPALPTDFWTAFPGDSSDPTSPWTTIGSQTVPILGYSGASVGGTAADNSVVLAFDWTGPAINPSLPAFRHHCLFAVITSPDDPVSANSMTMLVPDLITPSDNNVTHRNVSVQDPTRSGRFLAGFYVRNPFPEHQILTRLVVTRPKGWEVALSDFADEKVFELDPLSEKPVEIKIASIGESEGIVEIRQEILDREQKIFTPLGGFTFAFTR